MDKPVDQGDDAGGVGKHLVPLAERLVGRHDNGSLQVAAADDLVEQVGMPVVVAEVAHFVDHQQRRGAVVLEPPL